MPLRSSPCLVCGEEHEYNWDYITCEQRELNDTALVSMTEEQFEAIKKYLSLPPERQQ